MLDIIGFALNSIRLSPHHELQYVVFLKRDRVVAHAQHPVRQELNSLPWIPSLDRLPLLGQLKARFWVGIALLHLISVLCLDTTGSRRNPSGQKPDKMCMLQALLHQRDDQSDLPYHHHRIPIEAP